MAYMNDEENIAFMTQKEIKEMFRLLYKLEERLEYFGRNLQADKIAEAIRTINEAGVREMSC